MSGSTDFYARMAPYAAQASGATGIPAETILAQWALESARGTSQVARSNNNFAGIRRGGTWMNYPSVEAFVSDWVVVAKKDRYAEARSSSPEQAAVGLGKGGWDLAQYRDNAGAIGGRLTRVLSADRSAIAEALGKKKSSPSLIDQARNAGQYVQLPGTGISVGSVLGAGDQAAKAAPYVVIPGTGVSVGDVVGDVVGGVGGAVDAVGGAVEATTGAVEALGGLASTLTRASFWRRIGIGAAGVVLLLVAGKPFIESQVKGVRSV